MEIYCEGAIRWELGVSSRFALARMMLPTRGHTAYLPNWDTRKVERGWENRCAQGLFGAYQSVWSPHPLRELDKNNDDFVKVFVVYRALYLLGDTMTEDHFTDEKPEPRSFPFMTCT